MSYPKTSKVVTGQPFRVLTSKPITWFACLLPIWPIHQINVILAVTYAPHSVITTGGQVWGWGNEDPEFVFPDPVYMGDEFRRDREPANMHPRGQAQHVQLPKTPFPIFDGSDLVDEVRVLPRYFENTKCIQDEASCVEFHWHGCGLGVPGLGQITQA